MIVISAKGSGFRCMWERREGRNAVVGPAWSSLWHDAISELSEVIQNTAQTPGK